MKTHTELDDLPIFKDYKVLQVSTNGRYDRVLPTTKWKEGVDDNVPILVGEKYVFPEMEGPGKIINIWFTFSPAVPFKKGMNPHKELFKGKRINKKIILRHWKGFLKMVVRFVRATKKPIAHKKLYLRIYFDDEEKPSVDCPIGDFFGTGFGLYKHYWSRYLNTTAGGYVCNFHMPFKKKARVEIVNTSQTHAILSFYGAIAYAKYASEEPIRNMGYFHAQYHEEHPTTPNKPFLFLDTKDEEFFGKEGRGHLVGFILSARSVHPKKNHFSYLAGNTEMYINGEKDPSLMYTGTEDIFQGAWYYQKGIKRKETEFCSQYHGLNMISQNKRGAIAQFLWSRHTKCKTSQYRFFPEGIPFEKSIKVILHHGEDDDIPAFYDGVTYWYQER